MEIVLRKICLKGIWSDLSFLCSLLSRIPAGFQCTSAQAQNICKDFKIKSISIHRWDGFLRTIICNILEFIRLYNGALSTVVSKLCFLSRRNYVSCDQVTNLKTDKTIANSAQTEYCSTFLCVLVTGVTSQVFSII